MPATEAQAAFRDAAAADGIALEPRSCDFLSEQGHVGLERVAQARRDAAIVAPVKAALVVLEAIYARLRGDLAVLRSARENLLLALELVHPGTGTVVEVDGAEHFTSARLVALDLYPPRATVGFDVAAHRELCRAHAPSSDQLSRGLAAKGFGFGGVLRERAYRDALVDLATPAMGRPPVLRVAAVDGDGAAAYARVRDAVAALTS